MDLHGHVKGGVIVIDGPLTLPDGTAVRITADVAQATEIPSLYERLKPVVGAAQDLPEDMALNHDHYLHGTPKR